MSYSPPSKSFLSEIFANADKQINTHTYTHIRFIYIEVVRDNGILHVIYLIVAIYKLINNNNNNNNI